MTQNWRARARTRFRQKHQVRMSDSRRGTAQRRTKIGGLPERQVLRWSKAEYENEGKGERKQRRVGTAERSLSKPGEGAMAGLSCAVGMFAAARLAGNDQLHLLEATCRIGADRNSESVSLDAETMKPAGITALMQNASKKSASAKWRCSRIKARSVRISSLPLRIEPKTCQPPYGFEAQSGASHFNRWGGIRLHRR
jgi:hypothetical protein